MISFLLGIILFAQGLPALSTTKGTVTGVLKTAAGEPAAGVRVTALAQPDSIADVALSASFASLAETDENGRYRLEDIPPGRYYIAAGRVDLPTYYPGTLEMSKGTPVSIASTAIVSNIDFAVDDASARLPDVPAFLASFLTARAGLTMPLQVRMEGGGKQPISANGLPVTVRLTRTESQTKAEMALNSSSLNFPIPDSVPGIQYRVTVENIPSGYLLKSMTQGGVDLMSDTLKISAANFVQSSVSFGGATAALSVGGPMTPLEIILAAAPPSGTTAKGVRVTGRAASVGNWYLNLSGTSGILFSDGSFEFRGVAPGRHVIMLQDKPDSPARVFAASVVVGDKDLGKVLADDTRVLPVQVQFPAGTPPPGSIIPLAWIHGHVDDETSKEPVFGGVVTITGKNKATFPIDSEGQFEIPRLLPGSYDLTIEGFQHASIQRRVTVGDDDVPLRVSSRATN